MSKELTLDKLPTLCRQAIRDLTEASDIASVFNIRDQAEAFKVYAKKRKASIDARNACGEIVILCERRIGEELEKIELSKGGNPVLFSPSQSSDNDRLADPTLRQLGLTKDQSSQFQQLAKVPVAEIKAATKTANAEGREVNRRTILKENKKRKDREKDTSFRKTGRLDPKLLAPKGEQEPAKVYNPKVPAKAAKLQGWVHFTMRTIEELGCDLKEALEEAEEHGGIRQPPADYRTLRQFLESFLENVNPARHLLRDGSENVVPFPTSETPN